jgi:Bacterial protein of unknown function (DUF839)
MSRSARTTATLALAMVLVAAASLPARAAPTNTGPSTETAPYVLPVADGVEVTSILTVSDAGAAANGYEMVGIPDGLGAQLQGNNLIVTMNHELGQAQGIARAHGQAGAFVSRLVIDPGTLQVKAGSDWIQAGVEYWDYPNGTHAADPDSYGSGSTADLASFARFCSGDLTVEGQLYNASTRNGFRGAVYFANEEVGPDGRVFAVLKDGDAWQLPRLGLFSWENTLGASNESDTTVVMGNEDQSNIAGQNVSQLWVYGGEKQRAGTAVDKAGLTNGENHVLTIPDADPTNDPDPTDDGATRALIAADPDGKVRFELEEVDWDQSGAAQNDDALAVGMSLNRIEDGEFDPNDKNVFYFVTTEGSPANPPETPARDGGGLWRVTFDDIENPDQGGTLELLLDGTEPIFSAVGGESKMNKPDNMTIDSHGNVLIQEDPGGNAHLARIVAYRISDGALGVVTRFDPAQFSGATPLTIDEESSGVIDTEALLGEGTFLFDAQVHTSSGLDDPAAQVERGQLMHLFVPDWTAVYGS